MPLRRRVSGFTLIELMIVITIIGILATIALPKFASLARKSKEGALKGDLGAIRSAINIYYSDMEGWYPTNCILGNGCTLGGSGFAAPYALDSLTVNAKYLPAIPKPYIPDYHGPYALLAGVPVTEVEIDPLPGAGISAPYVVSDGVAQFTPWAYFANYLDLSSWGQIEVNCTHTDTKGSSWSTY